MMFITAMLAASLIAVAPDEPPADANLGEPALVTLRVVDAETGEPLERFQVVPGVPYRGTDDRSVAVWQPHLVRESTRGRYTWPRARSYQTFRLRVEARDYRPEMTPWLHAADGPTELTIRLRRDRGIRGVVLSPDGAPAAGATLALAIPNRTVRLLGKSIDRGDERRDETPNDRWRRPVTIRTDAQGRYRLPTEHDPSALLVVVHEAGYLQRPVAELLADDVDPLAARTLRLAPWGRIAGSVVWGERPAANEAIELIVSRESRYPDMVGTWVTAHSDGSGRFEFTSVPPGPAQLSRPVPSAGGNGEAGYAFPVMHVDVPAGKTIKVVIGGRGRVVTGRLTGLDSYAGLSLRVHPTAPHIGLPGDDAQWRGWNALRESSLGAVVFRDAIAVRGDGTFQIEGLVPESYQLFVNDPAQRVHGGASFTVKPDSEHGADAWQDIGPVPCSVSVR